MGAGVVCPDILAHRGTAITAVDELAQARNLRDLLTSAHLLWCGTTCEQAITCGFLHYPRETPARMPRRAPRSRYNKDTAHLFGLMGGQGYAEGVPQRHAVNSWPLLTAVMAKADEARLLDPVIYGDYSGWTRKNDTTATQTTINACRDSIQWMASWCGGRYADAPEALHYIAFSTICDDLCVPPLDLAHGRFGVYGRTMRDLAQSLDAHGWGLDGVHLILSLVRQYIVQYAEKAEFHLSPGPTGLHARLNGATGVWDSVIYRTHTANTYGAAVAVSRIQDCGPATFGWLMDSSICDAISMDLCKSALMIYSHDLHQPTAGGPERQRQTAYHSTYLDLIDDLADSGAPEPLIHFARAGFLFVQIQDRYQERRTGQRFPLSPAMTGALRSLFGDQPSPFLRRSHPGHSTSHGPGASQAHPSHIDETSE
jgi:hypothetical protein